MSVKKIFLIIILVIFVLCIGFVLVNANNKSIEEISEISNNTKNSSSTISYEIILDSEKIRKSTQKPKVDTNNMVKITDSFFIGQTDDLYYNLDNYIGKTIKIEGVIYSYEDSNGDICYAVVRQTPGCCGSDGIAGIDIRYDEEYPKENTWVEVIGVIGTDTMFGSKNPAIFVSSITEKEPGQIFVTK